MRKTYKVVILPTGKENWFSSPIIKQSDGDILHLRGSGSFSPDYNTAQHIHVVSKETIKQGDWSFIKDNLVQALDTTLVNSLNALKCPKIIASTDKTITPKSWIDYIDNDIFTLSLIASYNQRKLITDIDLEVEPKIQKLATGEEVIGSESEYNLKLKTFDDDSVILYPSKTYTRDELESAFEAGKELGREGALFDFGHAKQHELTAPSFNEWIELIEKQNETK